MARNLQVLTLPQEEVGRDRPAAAVSWSWDSQSLRRFAKTAVAYALYYLGILHLWRMFAMRHRAVVLMYHRVLTARQWEASGSHPGIVVRPETFRRQLDFLRRHFSVLSVREFVRHIETGTPFPHSSCLITFDDGWYDNLTNAAAHLREVGLPAVMFLPVNYLGTRRCFWRESISHLVLAAVHRVRTDPSVRANLATMLRPFGLDLLLELAEPRLMEQVVGAVASLDLPRDAAERLVADLVEALGVELSDISGPDCFLSWNDLERLSVAGFSFGSHGSEHLRLADVPRDVARHDIMHSREALSGVMPDQAPTFSYPNGAWTAAVAEEVRAAGFRVAFTTDNGLVSACDNPLAIRRVNVQEDATFAPPLFLARILGLF